MNGLVLWLYEIPTFWLCFLVSAAFLVFSLGGLHLTRSWVRRGGDGHNDLANSYIAGVGVFYALLIGLISVASWENYTDVESTVSNEAVVISNLYRDFEGYPPGVREVLKQGLRRYALHVVDEEWPDQRRGIVPAMHDETMTQVSRRMAQFEPTTVGQQIIHAECLRQFNSFLAYRRLRLQAIDNGLPSVMWIVVLLGAVITIGMTWFLWSDNLRLHTLLTACLALIIALVIFLIFVLDEPLVGRVSVDPEAFEEVLSTVMEAR